MSYVLVTGAANGLGKKIAVHLLKAGYKVIIHYKNSLSKAQKIAEKFPNSVIQYGDFSTQEGVETFIKEVKHPVSILINNVGPYLQGPLSTINLKDFTSCFFENCTVVLKLIQSFLPTIKKDKGAIVNIGVCGLHREIADIYTPGYTLAKLSLYHLTRSFAKELVESEVSVNMVSPGYLNNSIDKPIKNIPIIDMEQVVDLVYYLIDSKNKHITGQNIEVSAGVRL